MRRVPHAQHIAAETPWPRPRCGGKGHRLLDHGGKLGTTRHKLVAVAKTILKLEPGGTNRAWGVVLPVILLAGGTLITDPGSSGRNLTEESDGVFAGNCRGLLFLAGFN
jgi:hypothetical protein